MSGTPFTVFDSNDVSAQGSAPEITGFSAQRPNLVAIRIQLGAAHGQRLAQCQCIPAARPGPNSARDSLAPPGATLRSVPITWTGISAVLKNIKVAESMSLQFRAELFNILNHPNFRLPDSDISSPTFNQILAAAIPRQVQFALKFLF